MNVSRKIMIYLVFGDCCFGLFMIWLVLLVWVDFSCIFNSEFQSLKMIKIVRIDNTYYATSIYYEIAKIDKMVIVIAKF